jgi:hypothetical protein
MTNFESFCLGSTLGFIGVGLPTLRTLKTIKGDYLQVFFISLACSANLYAFTNFVVEQNYYFMTGNMFFAATSVALIAKTQQKTKEAK